MDLYRIILMDDEEEARQSVIGKINWTEAGLKVVENAENGGDALERVEALEPGLILTDIRIPYMGGLTLTGQVRQKYPSVKIVIFPGCDDLGYAKQAIKLNMTEHILRPVSAEGLTAILKRIRASLDKETERKKNINLLWENYTKSLPILREQPLNELASYPMPETEVGDKLREYAIPPSGAKKRVTATTDIEPEEIRDGVLLSLHRGKDLIPIFVMQFVEEKLRNYYRCAPTTLARTMEFEIAVIAAIDEENSQTGLIDVLGDVYKGTRRILEMPITIGVGHGCQRLSGISSSYKATMDTLGYKAAVGSGSTIYINDVEPVDSGKLQSDGKDEAELISAIKSRPREKIEAAVQTITDKMSDTKVHFRQCQAYMLSVSSSIVQMIQQYDLDMEQLLEEGSEREGTFVIIPRMQKREDFSQWFLSTSPHMNQVMNQEHDNTMKQVIQEAKQYIMDNYQDLELLVERICRRLHTGPAYLSITFKKEIGQACIIYLTEVRLDKVVEPLDKADDRTYIIVARVGYQKQNYFNYVFKKRFGISPAKFRGTK